MNGAQKKLWREEVMKKAVTACSEGMAVREAVRLYKVPRSTLADRVCGRVAHGSVSGPGQLLSKADELSLVRHCQYMASHGHPLTKAQCIAFGNSIRRERDPSAKSLSRTWWRNFRQRHREELTLDVIDRGRAVCAREKKHCPVFCFIKKCPGEAWADGETPADLQLRHVGGSDEEATQEGAGHLQAPG